jgi:hypothetical protein
VRFKKKNGSTKKISERKFNSISLKDKNPAAPEAEIKRIVVQGQS